MKSFTENDLVTDKQKLLESFQVESGLPIETCEKLYEDLGLGFVSAVAAKAALGKYLATEVAEIIPYIKEVCKALMNKNIEDKYDALLVTLNQASNSNVIALLKIIVYLLFMKDKVNFVRIAESMNIDRRLSSVTQGGNTMRVHSNISSTDRMRNNNPNNGMRVLNESLGVDMDWMYDNFDGENIFNDAFNQVSAHEDIRFYTELKHILARNNKRWGANYHLDNVYDVIMEFLDRRTEEIKNSESIHTVDSDNIKNIISGIMRNNLPLMYRDITYLRPLVSDIQTLVFDMMLIVNQFYVDNKHHQMYMSRKLVDEYRTAYQNLFTAISSSKATSNVLEPDNYNNLPADVKPTINGLDYQTNLYTVYGYNPNVQATVDALYIMKSCVPEFSLHIRPYISKFITKGFELVGKLEHIILEAQKVNRFKSH